MNYYYTHFDRLFEEITGDNYFGSAREVPKESSTVKLPSYPPCDCFITDDRNTLSLCFAMAGCREDSISVTATEGSITVSALARDIGEGFVAVHNGISRKPINFTVGIDDNYDSRKAETSFEDGMLFLELPIKKSAQSVKLM